MSDKKIKKKSLVLVILGPTASGKTSLAVYLANKYSGEIVSADSRQVYQGMDIGTGKDLPSYQVGKKKIPYHLIDVAKPSKVFNLANYQKLAFKAIEDILKRNKLPILVGGSGLYLQAVVDNYQLSNVKANMARREELEALSRQELFSYLKKIKPNFAKKLNNSDKNNKRRLIRYLEIIEEGQLLGKKDGELYKFLIIGLKVEKEVLKRKNAKRLRERLDKEDMIAEVRRLKKEGLTWKRLKSFGLEYKFISQYLLKEISYQEMLIKLETAINQFSKRQNSWFKRWEKQGRKIYWLKYKSEAEKLLNNNLKRKN